MPFINSLRSILIAFTDSMSLISINRTQGVIVHISEADKAGQESVLKFQLIAIFTCYRGLLPAQSMP